MKMLLRSLIAVAGLALVALPAHSQQISIAGYRSASLPCDKDVFIPVAPSGSGMLSQYLSCAAFATYNSLGATLPGAPTRYLGLDVNNVVVTGTPSGGSGSGNISGPGSSTDQFVPQWSGGTGTLLGAGLPVATLGGNGSALVETTPGGFISNTLISGLPNANLANSTIGLSVPSWLTTGSPAPLGGTLAISSASAPANQVLATPNGSVGVLSPRALVSADLPLGSATQFGALECGTGTTCTAGVISVAGLQTLLNAQFLGYGAGSGAGAAQAVSIVAGTAISFTCSAQTCTIANTGLMGPGSSTNLFVPQWSGTTGTALATGLPVSSTGAASALVESTSGGLIPNSLISALPNANLANSSFTVIMPSWFTATGNPVSLGGTLTVFGTSEPANQVLATPDGTAGALAPRALVPADLPLGSATQFGALKCGSGTTCTAGTVTVSGSGLPTVNNAQFLGYGAGSGSGTAQAVTVSPGTGITFVCSAQTCTIGASGSGGVSGPGSSVNNDVVAWNGTAGNALIDTGILYTNLPTLSGTNVYTGANTFASGNVRILGSSTGYTALASADTIATNFTVTFPAATDTVVLLAAAQALTGKTYNGLTVTANGTNTLNVAAGKTLTDTSGAGPVLLLGTTGGGFTGYAGVTCTNQFLATLSTAGVGTCGSVTTASIAASAVTYAKLQNENANTVLGNATGSAAAPAEITLATTGTSVVLKTDGSGNEKAPVNTTTGTFSGALTAVGGSLTALMTLALRDTSAAFDLTLAATSSTALTAARTLTLDVVNGARTLKLGSNLTLASDPGVVTGALRSNGTGTFSQAACADLSGGCPALTTTDGTNTISNTTTMTFGTGFVVGGSAGSATVGFTVADNTKTASYTVTGPDMFGALNLAGTAGTPVLTLPAHSSTIFGAGMSVSIAVTGTVPWTITNSTGLAMTGLNTTTLPPGSSGSFIANSNGTGIDFFAGVQPATATVIGGILTTTYAALAGNNVWIGQNSTPPVALTFSSSITPNFAGSVDLTATLTGTTTINCPTGPQAVGQKPVFYLTQGTGSGAGGFQATWDTCYGFPNHQPPVLTADSDGAKDMVGCSVIAASGPESIWCGTVQTAIGYGFLLRNNHSSVACTSATTCAITVSNVVAGDMVAFGVMESGSAGNPAAGDLVSISDANGNTCTRATGTFKVNTAAAPRATSISYCTITTSVPSGDVWTATWTPTEQFMTLHFVEVLGAAASPDIGKGNGATATSNAQTVTATGADTQPYQFVLAMLKGDSLGTVSAGAGFTLLDVQGQGTNPSATEYRFLPTATTATATFSTSASANYALSAAIFAHK